MRPIRSIFVLALLGVTFALPGEVFAAEIAILPGDFTLSSPAARQTLLVQESSDGKLFAPLSKDVTLTSSDEKIVKIDAGAAVPVANGVATVTATSGTRAATAKVTVTARMTAAHGRRGRRVARTHTSVTMPWRLISSLSISGVGGSSPSHSSCSS